MAKQKRVSRFNSDFVKLLGIHVNKSLIEDVQNMVKEEAEVEIKLGQKIGYNFDEKMCKVELAVELNKITTSQSTHASASFEVAFHFMVENMEECVEKSEVQINIDSILPAHLVGMAYSSLRGILFEKLSNTSLRNFILPVINPYEILKNK